MNSAFNVEKILIPTPFFAPSFKAGGACKSLTNLVDSLGHQINFDVHCLNVDIDKTVISPPEHCRNIGLSKVIYHSPSNFNWRMAKSCLEGARLLYLNSFFAPAFSLRFAALRRWRRTMPMLVAPRGELFGDALASKGSKKRAAIAAIRASGLYADAAWQASTPAEYEAIERMTLRLGIAAPQIFIASDIANVSRVAHRRTASKITRIIFLGRITPIKNLDFALRAVIGMSEPCNFDIYGPIEDAAHWQDCLQLIKTAPDKHTISYRGPVAPDAVIPTLTDYDLYFLPSKSENFGHSIQEALTAGLPVLISDRTPWRDLETAGAGWDLPLDQSTFTDALDRFASLSSATRNAMREHAQATADRFSAKDAIAAHRHMFSTLLNTLPLATQ
ncbi:glycosyltransferase [Sphingomonas sp. XXL09]|uniref:glycosyltransferase n=1 Tax=Sphingomonas sp. XXL09 TaxID=3457787 RepID=UPI00406BAD31